MFLSIEINTGGSHFLPGRVITNAISRLTLYAPLYNLDDINYDSPLDAFDMITQRTDFGNYVFKRWDYEGIDEPNLFEDTPTGIHNYNLTGIAAHLDEEEEGHLTVVAKLASDDDSAYIVLHNVHPASEDDPEWYVYDTAELASERDLFHFDNVSEELSLYISYMPTVIPDGSSAPSNPSGSLGWTAGDGFREPDNRRYNEDDAVISGVKDLGAQPGWRP